MVDNILKAFPHRHDLDLPLTVFRTAAGAINSSALADLSIDSGDFSQKHLSHLIDTNLQSSLFQVAEANGDRRFAARLHSLTLPQAGAFLNAIPNPTFGLSILPTRYSEGPKHKNRITSLFFVVSYANWMYKGRHE